MLYFKTRTKAREFAKNNERYRALPTKTDRGWAVKVL